jgi:glycosyltransferase involved in cell wall biosynthesis
MPVMKFSIVIPLYNKERTILRTISSILNQTYQDFEIIVIDDGSTDNSNSLVSAINSPNIKIFKQKNAGVSSARNAGIKYSNNDWIAFIDGDDEWIHDYLKTIVTLHNLYPNSRVLATSYFFGNNRGTLIPAKLNKFRPLGNYGTMDNYFKVASKSSPPIWSSAVVIHKAELERINGFPINIKLGEDILTWARLAINNKIGYCILPCSIFWHDVILPSQIRIPEYPDHVGDNLIALLNGLNKSERKYLKMYISHWYKMRAHLFITANLKNSAYHEIRLSLSYNPFNLKTWLYIIYSFLPAFIQKKIYSSFTDIERKVT